MSDYGPGQQPGKKRIDNERLRELVFAASVAGDPWSTKRVKAIISEATGESLHTTRQVLLTAVAGIADELESRHGDSSDESETSGGQENVISMKRLLLMRQSHRISDAADKKLSEETNVAKGDDWELHEYDTLLGFLKEEVEEVFDLLKRQGSLPPRYFQSELLLECGDVLNAMRFLCDKTGAFD